jgi:endonuclease G, mitochondrial
LFICQSIQSNCFIFEIQLHMSKKNQPNIGGGNTTIGGIIVAIILALLYFINGGDNSTTPATDEKVVKNNDQKNIYDGLKNYLPTSTTGKLINHTYYTVSYSLEHKQAEWVAYELRRDMVNLENPAERDNLSFRPDPNLEEKDAIKTSDYTGSGYDRGHLVPAHDMAFKEEAMRETFYMTNVSPQDKEFNRGKWKELEGQTRKWADEHQKIHVITGPILTQKPIKRFPKNKKAIPVPPSFYKIILDFTGKKNEVKVIAFLLPNKETDKPLSDFAITVDEIEVITGIDFFPELPNGIEEKLESQINLEDWGMTQGDDSNY